MISSILSFALVASRTTPPRPLAPEAIEECAAMLWSHAVRKEHRAFPAEWSSFLLRHHSHAKILLRISSGDEKLFRSRFVSTDPALLPNALVHRRARVITAVAHGSPADLQSLLVRLRNHPRFQIFTVEILGSLRRGPRLDFELDEHVVEARLHSPSDLMRTLRKVPSGSLSVDDVFNHETYVILTDAQLAEIPSPVLDVVGIPRVVHRLDRLPEMPNPEVPWRIDVGRRHVFSLVAYGILQRLAFLDRARGKPLSEASLSLIDRIVMDASP